MNEKQIQQVLEIEKADAVVRFGQLLIETLPTSRYGENQRVGGCFDRCRISSI